MQRTPFLQLVNPLAFMAELLADLFGPLPFHTVYINDEWLAWNDGTIPKIAQSVYEEGTFADLPILADALEEAGCTNADLVNHCRSGGPHVKGCWAVDLILGKQ